MVNIEDYPITRENEYVDAKWVEHLRAFRAHIKNDPLSEFMMWSTTKATMQVDDVVPFADAMHRAIKESDFWDAFYSIAYDEKFSGVYKKAYGTNPNRIVQLAHLNEFFKRKRPPEISLYDSILEIGGGYGSLADIIYRMLYFGEYRIVDLPEVSFLQEYYLGETQPDKRIKFMQVYEGRFPVLPEKVDLLIGIASLSEMPIALRKALLGMVEFRNALILFQETFFGVDNLAYFKELERDRGGEIVKSPYMGTHYYYIK